MRAWCASGLLVVSLASAASGDSLDAGAAGAGSVEAKPGGPANSRSPAAFEGAADAGSVDAEPLTTVVTGSRSLTRLTDSAVPTEVLTRRQILETGARDVAEALQARAGVELFPSLGGTQLRMQGLGPEYSLLIVDGQRAVGRVNGALDLSRYSVEDLEQLELVKGPSSVLWGSDALAGVLHLVTRPPRRPFGASALVSYGMLNQVDARASTEVSAGDFGARGSFAFGQRDAFDLDPTTVATSGSGFRSFQGAVRGTYGRRTEGHFIDVRAAALSRVQRGVDGSATGAVFDRATGDVLGEGSAFWTTPLGPGRVTVSAGLNLWSRRFVLDQRGASALDQQQDSTDRNVLVTGTYDVTLGTHRVLVGLETLGEDFASERIAAGRRLRGRASVFAQDTWAPFGTTKLVLVPGARVDLDSLFGPVVTPRLAVRFDPHPTLALRAAVGTGFRAPSFQELFLDFENLGAGYVIVGNPRLGPERSVGATLSADWQPHERVTVAASLFWNELSNMIAYESLADDAGLRFTYANVERARSRGAELTATVSPTAWLQLGLGGTLTDARNLTLDQPLDNQALARLVGQARLRLRELGVTALVRASVTSGRPLTTGELETRYTAPFALVDARIAKTFFERLELFVVLNNLAGAGNATDLLLTPRQLFGGASFTW